MGVDHTAFSCYGVLVEMSAKNAGDYDELLDKKARKTLQFIEWGSRPYSGNWGVILTLKATYQSVDFDGGPCVRKLAEYSINEELVLKELEAAVAAIPDCKFDGTPGWFVAGSTW